MRIYRRMQRAEGALHISLKGHPLRREFNTVSAWRARAALDNSVRAEPHRSSMRHHRHAMTQATFVFWDAPHVELPIQWNEAADKSKPADGAPTCDHPAHAPRRHHEYRGGALSELVVTTTTTGLLASSCLSRDDGCISAQMWLVLAIGALWLWLATETGVGSRRRGSTYTIALISGLCFPVTRASMALLGQRVVGEVGRAGAVVLSRCARPRSRTR